MLSSGIPLNIYLKQKREECQLSQGEVARHLGYSSSQMVSNWERGLCHPPLSKLKEIAALYRIKSTELIDIMIQDFEKHIEAKINISTAKEI